MKRRLPVRPKRIVVKVGSAVLTSKNYRLNRTWMKRLVAQIAAVVNANIEVILVTSGAIGAGMGILGLDLRPRQLRRQQAAAAVGQGQLMKIYDSLFRQQGLVTAQILLTREDLSSRKRYLNAKNTLFTLLGYKIVPIINENDTVSVDEIKFGDNDRLSALVANLVCADLLIILTDVDALYPVFESKKSRAKKAAISVVEKIIPEIERLAKASTGKLGIGGMASKIEAAKICCASGVSCIVANGKTPDILLKILEEQDLGTLFLPKQEKLLEKKRWIGFSARVAGRLIVDEGAKQALTLKKKSLLPKGIVKVCEAFAVGDTISILDGDNREFARGLSNYSSDELSKIKGIKTDQIKSVLGYKYYDEVVHRDNLVII
jgi:glutamate 5-kinase